MNSTMEDSQNMTANNSASYTFNVVEEQGKNYLIFVNDKLTVYFECR